MIRFIHLSFFASVGLVFFNEWKYGWTFFKKMQTVSHGVKAHCSGFSDVGWSSQWYIMANTRQCKATLTQVDSPDYTTPVHQALWQSKYVKHRPAEWESQVWMMPPDSLMWCRSRCSDACLLRWRKLSPSESWRGEWESKWLIGHRNPTVTDSDFSNFDGSPTLHSTINSTNQLESLPFRLPSLMIPHFHDCISLCFYFLKRSKDAAVETG